MKARLVVLLLLSWTFLEAQEVDTPQVLSYEGFIKIVSDNHPVSQQANLLVESGEQNLRSSKGGFDPILKIDYAEKQFDNKNYYQINKNELVIPSRIAANFRAGYEQNQGDFLNPQENVPSSGLVYAGIAIPLGSGLFIDERRKDLQQARLMLEASEIERQVYLNQLFLESSIAYWQWFQTFETYQIAQEAYNLANTRFLQVKQNFLQGNIPAIDTLEAFILVQNREIGRFDAFNLYQKAGAGLSNFLWSPDMQPLMLAPTVIPNTQDKLSTALPFTSEDVYTLLENLNASHPELMLYDNKLDMLDIDRRMKVEKLKPKLNVNYNFLATPVNGEVVQNFTTNDFTWGLEFSMPIFLRKERGDLKMTKIKIDQVDLQFQEKSLQINNKVLALHTEMRTLVQQIDVYRRTVTNYQSLLEGEKVKFRGGESSLFIVNSRENSLVDAEIKLVGLISKFMQTKARFYQATGNFQLDI